MASPKAKNRSGRQRGKDEENIGSKPNLEGCASPAWCQADPQDEVVTEITATMTNLSVSAWVEDAAAAAESGNTPNGQNASDSDSDQSAGKTTEMSNMSNNSKRNVCWFFEVPECMCVCVCVHITSEHIDMFGHGISMADPEPPHRAAALSPRLMNARRI